MSGQDAIGGAPGPEVIEAIARDAIARLPAAFAAHLGDVVLIVEEFADDETLAALGIDHPLDLTGLYHGRPVGEKSSMDSGSLPDRIHLYRRAILDEWVETGVRLDDLVVHVTIHEIGHHFGLSDADMHALEDAVDDARA
ncbi:MAG: metallopeptidase family protein [Sphingomonas parapaucimobilis]|jgi:predicted Zn-dependent protease with MMP-like domain|uniref:metallopeptidase family protein n=1 Tax=Sphingomonas sp. Sph1(2015) TaxID=1628084 RepID=UPI0009772E0B|nr:metallopeptidase family protein [Sphingomonas sp. Sph1(2015)]OMJ32087.1 neutral zinc metallopeptidase [Sphingomonas sp. Sph1(2015)]